MNALKYLLLLLVMLVQQPIVTIEPENPKIQTKLIILTFQQEAVSLDHSWLCSPPSSPSGRSPS